MSEVFIGVDQAGTEVAKVHESHRRPERGENDGNKDGRLQRMLSITGGCQPFKLLGFRDSNEQERRLLRRWL